VLTAGQRLIGATKADAGSNRTASIHPGPILNHLVILWHYVAFPSAMEFAWKTNR